VKSNCKMNLYTGIQSIWASNGSPKQSVFDSWSRFHEECGIISLRINRTKIDSLLSCLRMEVEQKKSWKYFYYLLHGANQIQHEKRQQKILSQEEHMMELSINTLWCSVKNSWPEGLRWVFLYFVKRFRTGY